MVCDVANLEESWSLLKPGMEHGMEQGMEHGMEHGTDQIME